MVSSLSIPPKKILQTQYLYAIMEIQKGKAIEAVTLEH